MFEFFLKSYKPIAFSQFNYNAQFEINLSKLTWLQLLKLCKILLSITHLLNNVKFHSTNLKIKAYNICRTCGTIMYNFTEIRLS